ncbi:GNAT family N-acetyltransferase [Pantoea sp. FN0302]|uniref:GNAT family N-acetyltransferase n=1 Tax=Pantoea sp. FN0302 TaxID=3418558 RepID=UPI003CEB0056
MSIYAVKIDDNFPDLSIVREINEEAFPVDERVPFDKLILMAQEEGISLSAVYDGSDFIGFYMVIFNEVNAYLAFIAIRKSQRSKGYGGKLLQFIASQYPDKKIILDIEREDPQATNYDQRLARQKFYLNNGFSLTGFFFDYANVEFEILANKPLYDLDDAVPLLNHMRLLTLKYDIEEFKPEIYSMRNAKKN